jgi:mannose-1-phosphate guanylyltransferase
MKRSDRYVIIMAGGRGERFWPVSREKTPKQLITLLGNQSLLQQTVERALPVAPIENILVITNRAQASGVRKQLPGLPAQNVIAEPCGRDTCAAIVLGGAIVGQRNPRGVMAVLPADHLIKDQKTFQRVLRDCFQLADKEEQLVTIGIQPTGPATGYGYIKEGHQFVAKQNSAKGKTRFNKVDRFVEKPNLVKARRFVKSGQYCWNAGMFVWSVPTLLNAFKSHLPEMAEAFQNWKQIAGNAKKLAAQLTKDYPKVTRISIDYALMEKASNTLVADGVFDWDDLGSWTALERHLKSDAQGNCSEASLVQVDSKNNIVFDARGEGKRQAIALVGVQDCIVVQTDDACMIASKSHGQQIKELVQLLAKDLKFQHLI